MTIPGLFNGFACNYEKIPKTIELWRVILGASAQGCISPHLFVTGDPSEVPLEECWMASPQLFFTCFLRPVGGRPPKRAKDTYGPDDIQEDLVLFSTFENLDLPGSGLMEARGVRKFYEPSQTPILYVGLISNVLGRVPLMPFFLHGNSTHHHDPTPAP